MFGFMVDRLEAIGRIYGALCCGNCVLAVSLLRSARYTLIHIGIRIGNVHIMYYNVYGVQANLAR